MNWIEKYRLNPDWFSPNDESLDSEKTNREEIFELIRNHDRLLELSDRRDAKISHLLEDEYYQDPLNYLNPYFDILFGKIDVTISLPQVVIYYLQSTDESDSVVSKNGMRMYQKSLSNSTICFSSEFEFIEWVDEVRKENELFVYQINSPIYGNSMIHLSYIQVPKSLKRIKTK